MCIDLHLRLKGYNQVGLDVGNVSFDAASVFASANEHVAIHAPSGAPRVAYHPIVEAAGRVFTVAHHDHGVIEVPYGVEAIVRPVNSRPLVEELSIVID